MDATNVVTSTDTVGIGYHCQEQPAHPRTITTTGQLGHHIPGTLQVDLMTGEAAADPILGYTRDRSASRSRHPSTDRHTSRDRNLGWRHTPDRN